MRRYSRTASSIAANHPEKKYCDFAMHMVAGTNRTVTDGSLISMVPIGTLGTATNQRSSASPVLKSLTIRGKLTTNTPAGGTGTPVRWSMYVVLDTAPLSTMPVNGVSDIFSTFNPYVMPTSFCVNNMDNSSRFKILKRVDIGFGGFGLDSTAGGNGQTSATVPIDFTLPLRITQKYKPTTSTSTISDITENALYIVSLSDQQYANSPTLDILGRVHFFDR